MAVERTVTVELEGGEKLIVTAEQIGPVLVDGKDIVAKLQPIVSSIEHVCKEVLGAVKRAAPTSATVELGFGLAIEQGQLITLFGKGKADATIKVSLEWSKADDK